MLVESLLAANERHRAQLAVTDGRISLSYRRLTLLSRIMRDIVLRESDEPRIGVMLPATAAFPSTLFGTLWASRVIVPLNFLLSPAELRDIVDDAGLDLILTVKPFQEIVEQLQVRSLFLEHMRMKRRMVLASLRRHPSLPLVDPDDTAVLLYTSGTTAEPKGVELTHQNLFSNTTDAVSVLDIEPGDRFLNILPPFHVFGLTGSVLVPVASQASVIAIPRFSPLGVVKTVRKHRVTLMLGIPSMYAAVLRTKSATREDFASVRYAVSGGEPLSERVRQEFHEKLGVQLFEGYGLTETSPVIAVNRPERFKHGTVGPPLPNVEIRVIDDNGHPLPPGKDGELLVRGPCVMKGYYRKPIETSHVLTDDGWLRTGDIVRVDDDGFISITGRKKEMLIIGGENVFPREIEAVLEDHPDVIQAAIIGIPDDMRGEAPIAFVLCREHAEVSEAQLKAHARRALAGFKVPKAVHIREDLPTAPTGKILKRKLHDYLVTSALQA